MPLPDSRPADPPRHRITGLEDMTLRLRAMDARRLGVEIVEGPQTAKLEALPPLAVPQVTPHGASPTLRPARALAIGDESGDSSLDPWLDPSWSPRALGEVLFSWLFAGAARDALSAARSAVHAAGDRGLRLRLLIDARERALRPLLALPWELLFDARQRNYLALDTVHPVVRSLGLPTALRPRALDGPLRVAVAIAEPTDLSPLNAKGELTALRALEAESSGSIQLEVLPTATLEALRNLLQRRRVDSLHFIGHGHHDPSTGASRLVFVGAGGRAHSIPATLLSQHLRSPDPPRLVVLNACHGARASQRAEHDPFDSVAAALALADVPAVVAMQWEISNEAAITLSRMLYPALADGVALESALTEARLAIARLHGLDGSARDWAAPALYLHAANGRLFDRGASAADGADIGEGHEDESARSETSIGDFRVDNVQRGVVVGHGSSVDGSFDFGGGGS
ncbi:MAG: CHAT domain-containing protein [Acidobacteriota bacterium]